MSYYLSSSQFVIHLGVSLSDVEGEAFMGALGVDRMEELIVDMVGVMEVMDAV